MWRSPYASCVSPGYIEILYSSPIGFVKLFVGEPQRVRGETARKARVSDVPAPRRLHQALWRWALPTESGNGGHCPPYNIIYYLRMI